LAWRSLGTLESQWIRAQIWFDLDHALREAGEQPAIKGDRIGAPEEAAERQELRQDRRGLGAQRGWTHPGHVQRQR
jgi:hypothetical protein